MPTFTAMDEKTLRALNKVTDRLATKIAEQIVDKLALRLADKIAERIVHHQRWAAMTDEEQADECLRAAGWSHANGRWMPPPKQERGRRVGSKNVEDGK